jgi:hypothetical protein
MDSLTFVGTATTLIRLGRFTLLTDPDFLHRGQRAYLGRGCGLVGSPNLRWPSTHSPSSTRWCSHTCTATTSIGWPEQDSRDRRRW